MSRRRAPVRRPVSLEQPVVRPIALLFGAALGLWFPDTDLSLPLLDHRSGITHSVLAAVVAWRLLPGPLALGVALGVAVTLTADLFPERWVGFAHIHFPLIGSIGGASAPWLAANAIAALVLVHRLAAGRRGAPRQRQPLTVWTGVDRTVALVSIGVAVVYMIGGEGKLLPLLALAAFWGLGGWIAGRLPRLAN